jgi:hypothetical protein
MATLRSLPHRWLVPLVAIAGAMLATAVASAREMGDKGGCAVGRGITQEGAARVAGAHCKFGRWNDPSDDGTSRYPSHEEALDDVADDDEKHQPVLASLQDTCRCWIIAQAESAPSWTLIRSAPSLSQPPLRC